MSDFSLTLVLQIKTSKIINDMAKVQQRSEKITAFGGIFFVLDKFDSILSSVIDSHLGLRSTLIGYQYSEITRAIFSVFCCGGDCIHSYNLPPSLQAPEFAEDPFRPDETLTLDDQLAAVEKRILENALKRHNGNRSAAGRELGVSPRMMNYRLNKAGLQ